MASCGSNSDSASRSSVDGSTPFDFEDWSDLQVNDLEYNKADRGAGYDNQFWALEIIGTYNGSSTGVLERLVDGLLGDDGILVQEYSTYERYDPESFGKSDFFSADVVPGTTIKTIFWFETDGSVKDAQIVLAANGKTVYVKPGVSEESEDSTAGKVCGDGGVCSFGQLREGPRSLNAFGFIANRPGDGAHRATGIAKLTVAAAKNNEGSLCQTPKCIYIETTGYSDRFVTWSDLDGEIAILRNGSREDFKLPNIEVLLLMCDYLFNPTYDAECDLDIMDVSQEIVYTDSRIFGDDCVWSSSFRDDKVIGLISEGSKIRVGLIDQKTECRVSLVSLF